jgi:hypothetical protein
VRPVLIDIVVKQVCSSSMNLKLMKVWKVTFSLCCSLQLFDVMSCDERPKRVKREMKDELPRVAKQARTGTTADAMIARICKVRDVPSLPALVYLIIAAA